MCYGACDVNNEYPSGKCRGKVHGVYPCSLTPDELDRLNDEADAHADDLYEQMKDRELERRWDK